MEKSSPIQILDLILNVFKDKNQISLDDLYKEFNGDTMYGVNVISRDELKRILK